MKSIDFCQTHIKHNLALVQFDTMDRTIARLKNGLHHECRIYEEDAFSKSWNIILEIQ